MRKRRTILRGVAAAAVPLLIATAAAGQLGVLEGGQDVSPHDYVCEPDGDAAHRAYRERMEWGQSFSRRWRSVEHLPHEVREGDAGGGPRDVDGIRDVLRNVAPALRRRLLGHGGRIVFHEGSVTGLDECRHLKGRKCGLYLRHDITYDDVVGLYFPSMKVAFVQTDRKEERVRRTLLHELGHMLDDALGYPSSEDEFDRVLDHDDALGDLGYPERIDFRDRKQSEYFADSFADYHLGVDRRLWQRRNRPAAARFWDDVTLRESAELRLRTELLVEAEIAHEKAVREARERRREAETRRPRVVARR